MDIKNVMLKAKDYTMSRHSFYLLEVERLKKEVELKNVGAITLEQLQGQLDYALSKLEMYTFLFCLIEKENK